MHVCIYVCMYVGVYIYVDTCLYTYIYICIFSRFSRWFVRLLRLYIGWGLLFHNLGPSPAVILEVRAEGRRAYMGFNVEGIVALLSQMHWRYGMFQGAKTTSPKSRPQMGTNPGWKDRMHAVHAPIILGLRLEDGHVPAFRLLLQPSQPTSRWGRTEWGFCTIFSMGPQVGHGKKVVSLGMCSGCDRSTASCFGPLFGLDRMRIPRFGAHDLDTIAPFHHPMAALPFVLMAADINLPASATKKLPQSIVAEHAFHDRTFWSRKRQGGPESVSSIEVRRLAFHKAWNCFYKSGQFRPLPKSCKPDLKPEMKLQAVHKFAN